LPLAGIGTSVSDLSRDEGLRRLEDAEAAARRALQTIERQVHLAKSGGEDDTGEMIRTAERELELALAELRGTRPEAGGTHEALGER
jgi:hypothetical protein